MYNEDMVSQMTEISHILKKQQGFFWKEIDISVCDAMPADGCMIYILDSQKWTDALL